MRHAERLDRGLAFRLVRIDEGARLYPGRQDRPRSEQPEMEAVPNHSPAFALPEISIGTVGGGNDRHLRVIDQVPSDTGQVGEAPDPVSGKLVGGPSPDSIRSFGVSSAPAEMTMSPSAWVVRSSPFEST